MPRRKQSSLVAEVLSSAESLKENIESLPPNIRDKIREIALSMIAMPVKRRGRPPKVEGKRRRGRPPKTEAAAEI
ncbi:MAG: hypothetical protein QXI59_03710 [Candidatus Bathyarchaeia archaeon]|nr:hypothetical protein [Candidatus Bathyarchaeota archaeon]